MTEDYSRSVRAYGRIKLDEGLEYHDLKEYGIDLTDPTRSVNENEFKHLVKIIDNYAEINND